MRLARLSLLLPTVSALSGCLSSSGDGAGPQAPSDRVDGSADAGAGCDPAPERCAALGDERPRRLSEHSAVYDPERREMIVFGGTTSIPEACTFGGAVEYVEETWIFDDACTRWTRVEGDNPSASGRHMAAFGDGALWVFGGRFRDPASASGPYEVYDDLFRFDVAARTWHNTELDGEPPPARTNGALIWDERRGRLWLFGGNASSDGASYQPLADLWSYDPESGSWREHRIAGPVPAARVFPAALYDAQRDAFVIYGGANETAFAPDAGYMSDLWALDLESLEFRQLHDGLGDAPKGRFWAGLAHDVERDRYVMFGGHDDQTLGNRNDTWAFDPEAAQWERLGEGDTWNAPARGQCDFPPDFTTLDEGAPERRSAHSLVYAKGCGHLLAFGGKTDCGATDDVWAFDGERWRQRLPATEGEACLRWRDDPDRCEDMCF